jgi:phytoene/squalene synthetase
MSHRDQTPFDNIESSHEYVALLADAVGVAITEIETDIAQAAAAAADRRAEALQLVLFNMRKLRNHMTSSRRILNDLRTLRRLLLEERTLAKSWREHAG